MSTTGGTPDAARGGAEGSLSWPAAREAENGFKIRMHAAKTKAASRKHFIALTQHPPPFAFQIIFGMKITAESGYIHLSIDALLPCRIFATWKNALAWPPQTTRLMSLALGKKGMSVSSGTLYQVA